MIDVKTLRISSIVANKHGFQFEVVGIFKDQVLCDFKGNEGDVFEFKPSEVFGVPLSEEWLVKFGFEHNEPVFESYPIHKYYVNKGVCLFYNEGQNNTFLLGFAEMRMGKYYAVGMRWIRYVHELQQAYQIMTGEELKLK